MHGHLVSNIEFSSALHLPSRKYWNGVEWARRNKIWNW